MWFTLLLFSTLSFAEEMSSEKYCFSSQARTSIARQKVTMILVPSDIVNEDDNCLVIQMRPHRRELIQRYLLSSFTDARIAFSSEEARKEPCRLKVEKLKDRTTDDLNINIGTREGNVIKVDTKSLQSEVMQIETLKDFELSVDQDEIKGTCRYINPNKYEIALEVRRNPKPLLPPLPPGSIVVINQLPPDQETSVLKTELQLSRGERISIGDVVKTLKDRNNSVSIRPEGNLDASSRQSSEKVFLELQ